MKKIILYLATFFIILATAVVANGQAEKILVKSIQTESKQDIVLIFDGVTEVEEWDKDYLRITTTVELTNFGESILEQLASVGRYGFETSTNEIGALLVSMPKIKNIVTIKGVILGELLSFKIQVPRDRDVRVVPTDATLVF